ncbi:hypothetical protein INT45_006498 [Circinella minor]|uniref:Uncharacterized protein n=1 Tax=Circinella minor TaxID=1195481 RepID=A0A8H7S2F0_9FUNG|nr:hypothetical protein INT45_006498 [Circinella minor]
MDVLKAELRQTQQNERYYRQQFDRVNKLYETLQAKVKELESALTVRSTKKQHHFTTHSVFSVSLLPIAAKSTQPQNTLSPSQLTLSSSKPTSSNLSLNKFKMQPPTISHEMKPAPAIIDTTTSAAVTPSARPKKVHPVPTYSHTSPTTVQPPSKKRKHMINKSACIQHSCVTNITEASKFFQFPDHNQTKFEYIHIPCLQRKKRQEIRQLFRSLKINTSRVLDISYPGRNIIGILVHQHYLPHINTMLQEANIPTLTNFDPIHPDNLKDPKYKSCSEPERSNISKQCHRQRCLRAIAAQPLTLITKIARFFSSKGWIDQSDFEHIMSSPRQL